MLLMGDPASPGIGIGTVQIIHSPKDASSFKQGMILVAKATNPDLVPIMKKASAFITNQGGLTCHAAIVARELHKPCIVGTKIGTRVFKDGDMVEVDAARGIIRKISDK